MAENEGILEVHGVVKIEQLMALSDKHKLCRGYLDSIKIVAWAYLGDYVPEKTQKKGVLHNILYSYGTSNSIDGLVYNLWEDFTCGLFELIKMKSVENGTIDHCKEDELELLKKVDFLKDDSRAPNDESNYPTKHFRSLMCDVLKGITEAEKNKIKYGVLSYGRIVVQVKSHEFTAKLLVLEEKEAGVPCSVWNIINSCLARGGFLSEEAIDLRKILQRQQPPGTTMFVYMTEFLQSYDAFPMIMERHPLLWDEAKCAKFLMKVGDFVRQVYDMRKGLPHYKKLRQQLDKVRFNWKAKVLPFENLASYYNTTFDFLRCIRNVDAHYLNQQKELQSELAPHSTKLFLYIYKEFPKLLMHTFYVVLENFDNFTDVFEERYFEEFFSLEYKLKKQGE